MLRCYPLSYRGNNTLASITARIRVIVKPTTISGLILTIESVFS